MIPPVRRRIILFAIIGILTIAEPLNCNNLTKNEVPNYIETSEKILATNHGISGSTIDRPTHSGKKSGLMGDCFNIIAGKMFEQRRLEQEKQRRSATGIQGPPENYDKDKSDFMHMAYEMYFPNSRDVTVTDIRNLMQVATTEKRK